MKDKIFPVVGAIQFPKPDDVSGEPKLPEWDPEWVYEPDDLVAYNGNIYRSLLPDNLGNSPDTSPLYWYMLDVTDEAGRLEVSFTAADLVAGAGKVLIGTIPSNRRAFEASLIVEEAFQNRPITIGDADNNTRIMMASENRPWRVASYDVWCNTLYPLAANLYVYMTGVSATGRGTAIIYYS